MFAGERPVRKGATAPFFQRGGKDRPSPCGPASSPHAGPGCWEPHTFTVVRNAESPELIQRRQPGGSSPPLLIVAANFSEKFSQVSNSRAVASTGLAILEGLQIGALKSEKALRPIA